ncbi:class I SAM-dependent methyltransferase [Aureimonas jatrophae]|uniref:Phosphatidylethanolamine/phosphatidyl-N-methylethanolamine N-methyltransferase n=1 Tax=Aureimonas jatrophae TaxID=1166073 RepID=A0A1H0IRD5_9HYPH|nr:methyltransferase domain-containing protein [Aureimonas jatrophae]MBB3952302.1 phosphatidylethanolamine/phosphatidyl-N-methylethanolamine N-methyltransferase [Aureimonas jatrophae]SDO33611.1 phosphatidylethanolamine/phosphatidyl-N-methylethanolamine N-methyltransferase [Aureimonas jatrophae]
MPALRPGPQSGREERRARRADLARFFGTWIRKPLSLGAVAPSSATYCATMAAAASTHLDGPILELGPGLGVVTRALLAKGVDPARITSIEYDADFARTLRERFPRVNVIRGDGFDLDQTLGDGGATRFAAILMAIPVVSKPQAERQALFRRYLDRLVPGGNITQLSYLVTPPVKPIEGVFEVSSTPIVWDNIPPARVWIYRKTAALAH